MPFPILPPLVQGTHLTLTCVICHGFGCWMYLAWEAMPVGTNWTWEVDSHLQLESLGMCCNTKLFVLLIQKWPGVSWGSKVMRSIDKTWQICRSEGRPLPFEFLGKVWSWNYFIIYNLWFVAPISKQKNGGTHLRLWLQADNTPKEARNSLTSQICILLCQQNLFTTCGHYHLVVGHTHEDVDGALSLVTTCLRQERSLQTPGDVIRCLEKKLSPVFAKKNMLFGVEVVDEVSWLLLASIAFFPISSQYFCWTMNELTMIPIA